VSPDQTSRPDPPPSARLSTVAVPICWPGAWWRAALAVPQALGYADIAGVPVELGLYAVPLALIAYAVFGTSGQLVVGPLSSVSVMSGSLVAASGRQCGAGRFTTAAAGRTLGQDCAAPDRLGGRVLVQADRDRVSATDREAMKYGGGQICGPRASSS
jgi:hypothetical protein